MDLEHIICYGAGSAYHWVEEVLEARLGSTILCVIDRNAAVLQPQFRCPVISPLETAKLEALSQQYRHVPVIITLGDQHAASEVCDALTQMGFATVMTLNALFEAHLGFQLEDHTVEALDALRLAHAHDIAEVRQRLSDNESMTVFDKVLEIYQHKKGQWIPSHPAQAHPFPPGLSARINYTCVVKCGIALDEIEHLLSQNAHAIQQLIGFEPDAMKFGVQAMLTENVISLTVARGHLNQRTTLNLMPFAVSSENAQKPFHSSIPATDPVARMHARFSPQHGGFGSRLRADGSLLVKTVTLDTALQARVPTVIFVDAEGEELNILAGAVECIRRHRPALVIALYHHLSHLWAVPDFILRQVEGYDLYVRNYTGFVYETFLYALPRPTMDGAA